MSAVADEWGGDAGEGEEVFGFAFLAAVETAASVQPRHRAFDDPSVLAQPLGGLDAAAGDPGDDAV
jgi:hypothetical protein